ncbi:MAG: hypothetical protein AVDCRST_MAG11-2324, partial [uncultured Gemmatimonadaceae bacterium]
GNVGTVGRAARRARDRLGEREVRGRAGRVPRAPARGDRGEPARGVQRRQPLRQRHRARLRLRDVRGDGVAAVDARGHGARRPARAAARRVPEAVRLRRELGAARRHARDAPHPGGVRRPHVRGRAGAALHHRHRLRDGRPGGARPRPARRRDPRERRDPVRVPPAPRGRAPAHRRLHVGPAPGGRRDQGGRGRDRRGGVREPLPDARHLRGPVRVPAEQHHDQQPAQGVVRLPRARAPQRGDPRHPAVRAAHPAVRHGEDALHHRGRRARDGGADA